MQRHSKIVLGAFAMLLSTTAMAAAEDKTINFIQCGDSVDPTYPPFITKWETANPGYKVNIEPVAGISARTR